MYGKESTIILLLIPSQTKSIFASNTGNIFISFICCNFRDDESVIRFKPFCAKVLQFIGILVLFIPHRSVLVIVFARDKNKKNH